ncbi:MAG TPA: Ig-like domain repeat protein [Gaiellaceae bacterium]|nr:Ig-like domain repeat protein [Gaiellaceae bacterium]
MSAGAGRQVGIRRPGRVRAAAGATLALAVALTLASAAGASSQTDTISYTGSVVTWQVPTDVGVIRITALGAGGGSTTIGGYLEAGTAGGAGAGEEGTFVVTPTETLQVIAGSAGGTAGGSSHAGGGGGGGSFVYRAGATEPMIAAGGGGGGGGFGNCSQDGGAGTTSVDGGDGDTVTGVGGGAGGTNGSGGLGAGGGGGGGGGYKTDGGDGLNTSGGKSVANGAAGAPGDLAFPAGGFGGGGNGGGGGGGGGGYSGGGGGAFNYGCQSGAGGGGGSYNAGADTSTLAGAAAATDGSVTIQYATTASSTALNSSTNPSSVDQSVTFTATVTGDSPTGTVEFDDGGSAISGCDAQTVDGGTGEATCTTSTLALGSHTITAAYSGDLNNLISSASALTQTIDQATSATTVVSSSNPSAPGDSVTFTATVSGDSPTGTVEFDADGTALTGCATQALSGDNAICATSALAAGSYAITAIYSGDTNNLPSTSSTLTQLVQTQSSGGGSTGGGGSSTTTTTTTTTTVATPPDTQPPTAPADLTARFSGGALMLTWQPATDNVAVDHYLLELNGKPLKTLPATATSVSVRTFLPHATSVFTVVAVDAAGNTSTPLATITVQPTPRPKAAPKRIPQWAWQVFAWQQRGRTGTRPSAAPTKLPSWYWDWAAWRLKPFELAAS